MTTHDETLADGRALESMGGYHRFKAAFMALAGAALVAGMLASLLQAHA